MRKHPTFFKVTFVNIQKSDSLLPSFSKYDIYNANCGLYFNGVGDREINLQYLITAINKSLEGSKIRKEAADAVFCYFPLLCRIFLKNGG